MKTTAIAAGMLLACTCLAVTAQAPAPTPPVDVPRHKCEPKPKMPGPALRQDSMVVRKLQREIDAYKTCMKVYADERAAAAKAHTDAGNEAINEYNATMKELQDAQQSK